MSNAQTRRAAPGLAALACLHVRHVAFSSATQTPRQVLGDGRGSGGEGPVSHLRLRKDRDREERPEERSTLQES